ncbi:MAG: hypothetical protein KC766_11185, partial [Myxococcales bacterium]|nr:hypothetical protein [Myxococcales bacterium]
VRGPPARYEAPATTRSRRWPGRREPLTERSQSQLLVELRANRGKCVVLAFEHGEERVVIRGVEEKNTGGHVITFDLWLPPGCLGIRFRGPRMGCDLEEILSLRPIDSDPQ